MKQQPLLSKHVIVNTCIPLFIMLCVMVILCISYYCDNNLSYQYIPTGLKDINSSYMYEDGRSISMATLLLCIWSLVLLIYNVIEGCIVELSIYYTHQSSKQSLCYCCNLSYIIKFIVLCGYILTLWFHSDLLASVIPAIFLFRFFGVQDFYSISWTFQKVHNCLCCTMERWFKFITYSCLFTILIVITIFSVYFYDIADISDIIIELLAINFVFFGIILLCVPIFNIILFVSLWRYAISLRSLIKIEYESDIINENTSTLIENKAWRAGIYFVLIFFVVVIELIQYPIRLIDRDVFSEDGDIWVFIYNVNVLSLLTLILWFERPSFQKHLICKQCNLPHIQSHHCEICGESMQSNEYLPVNISKNFNPMISDIDASDDDKKYDASDDEDDHQMDNEENCDTVSYGFGSFIYYELLKSTTYASFKQEMIETKHVQTMDEWDDMYEKAENLVQSVHAKKCIAINNHNNILKIQHISIPDILAIKFYTDLDDQQRKFRKSFRKISDDDTDRDVIARHVKQYYFWGKWLDHAITVYGDKINNKNITYYHGLRGNFMFSSLRQDFNIPTSVTTDIAVACDIFAGSDGIVLQLQCQWEYGSKWNRSKALSIEWISSRDEKEVLLFGNFNQLMIANIYLLNNRDMDDGNKLIIETINNFERLCNGLELDDRYDDEKHDKTMKMLIENELNEVHDDYFANIFHNICENRTEFAIKKMIIYNSKSPNILEILTEELDDNYIICCDNHSDNDKVEMIRIDNMSWTKKCVDCRTNAAWYCEQQKCQYKLCLDCSDMIRMLEQLLKNAKHVTEIKEYDAIKLKALRIESLKEKTLL